MTDQQRRIAQECLAAAESNTMGFPQIIGVLMEAGFEGYWVDYRNATATYHLPEGLGGCPSNPW